MMTRACLHVRVQYYFQQLNLQLQMTDKDSHHKNSKIFSLIRLKADCKIAPVRVDFAQPHLPTVPPTSILPTYNPDRSHCTPCFILPLDQKYYQENLPFETAQFEERIQRSLQSNGTIQRPGWQQGIRMAPPSSNYCQICQQKFQDYFQHIQLRVHRQREGNSQATQLIHALCGNFTSPVQNVGGKVKAIRKGREQVQKNSNKRKRRELSAVESPPKGQNFSTGLAEHSEIEFKG